MTIWLKRPGNALLLALLALNAMLTLYTAVVTLRCFPNAGDEYAYVVSAELFSYGRLSVPSPVLPRFFDHNHILNDGQYYGKYPPGWPLTLLAGMLLKVPWLVNPVLGIGTLLLLHSMMRRHFPPNASTFAILLLTGNAFFTFNSASFFSHTSCMFFITLSYYGFLNWMDDSDSLRDAFWCGLGAGMAFLIRPFTAVWLLLPAGLVMIVLAIQKRAWTRLALAVAPLAVAMALFLLYNERLTGDPWLTPFTKYTPQDRPRLPASLQSFLPSLWKYAGTRALELAWPWLPLCWVPALAVAVHPSTRRNPKLRILLASTFLLFLGYAFYPGDGGIGYGPRYCYETIAGLAVLMGVACTLFPRSAPIFLALCLAVNAIHFGHFTVYMSRNIREKTALFDLVKQEKLTNAVVILTTGSGTAHAGDLARNGIRFDGNVLFVRDRGEENADLSRIFPGRKTYSYHWDRVLRRGSLRPYGNQGNLEDSWTDIDRSR